MGINTVAGLNTEQHRPLPVDYIANFNAHFYLIVYAKVKGDSPLTMND